MFASNLPLVLLTVVNSFIAYVCVTQLVSAIGSHWINTTKTTTCYILLHTTSTCYILLHTTTTWCLRQVEPICVIYGTFLLQIHGLRRERSLTIFGYPFPPFLLIFIITDLYYNTILLAPPHLVLTIHLALPYHQPTFSLDPTNSADVMTYPNDPSAGKPLSQIENPVS